MKKITFLITALLFYTLPYWSQSPACGDTVYDSGGASGDYVSNELTNVTVYPDVTGDLVTFTFLSFDTEDNYDYLYVYDGPTTSSTLVGTYSGSSIPDPITSTDSTGALTFVFDSDGSVQYGGYEILISCGPPPACPAPSALAASNVTASTADISWSAGDAETSWEYQVVTAGTTAAESGIITSDNPLVLTGLSSNSSYDVYLRAVCGAQDSSAWIAVSFLTQCDPFETFPFTETFDSNSSTSNCWSVNNANADGDAWNTSYAFNTFAGDGVAAMYTDYNSGSNDDWLISPALVLTGNERLKFQQRVQSSSEPNDFEVLLSTTDNLPASFTNVLLANAEYSNTTYQEFIIDLSSFTGASYIAFHVASGGLDGWRLYIDEVLVEEIPASAPGCASNFTDTADESCGNYDFSVSWDTVSGADGYLLTAGTTSGGNDLVDALDLGSSTTYNFSSVIIGQNYFYTVTPYNVNGNADGCEEQSVRTAQEGCYCASVPTSNDGTGISSVSLAGTDFTSGGDITYEDFTTTAVSVGQSTTASLSVSYSTGYTYYTNTWVDFNDDYNFDASELVSSGSSSGTLDLSFLVPSTATIGNHRLRIVGSYYSSYLTNPEPCYNTSWGVTIDMTLDVTEPPACIAPSALAASNVTVSTADISWSAGGTETAYEYVYQAAGIGEPTGAGTQLTTTSVSLSGLSSNTDYEVYVRSACDDGSFSTWSGPLNFTTTCESYTVPYVEGFETGYSDGSPVGGCLTQEDESGTTVWTANSTATSYNRTPRTGSWNAYLRYGNTDWVFIPVDLVAGVGYTASVYARQDGSGSTNSTVGISYGTSATSSAMTNTIAADTGIINGDYQLISGEFTPAATATYFVGIKGYMNFSPWYISIDDISITETSLGVDDSMEMDFTYYPNPANDQLTIKAQRNVENITVFNMLGQVVLRQSPNSLECMVNMAEMQTGAYFVRVSIGNTIETVRVLKK